MWSSRKNYVMRINTNVSALRAQRSMSDYSKQIENATGKISSGSRVRNASDDAASLAIGSKQKANIRSQYQAIRNANDVISQYQTAEGAMNEISSILVRLKELSLQASSGHLDDSERGMLNKEYMQMRSEMERIASSSHFNGNKLLQDKTGKTSEFQVGIHNNENSKLEFKNSNLTITEFNLGIVDSSIINAEEARLNLAHIDEAISKVSQRRAMAGSIESRMKSTIGNLETSNLNESASHSRLMDADMAYETSEKLRNELKHNGAASVLAQASQMSAVALKLM